MAWAFIKPLLRRETIETLREMARGVREDMMTPNMKVVQLCAQEILQELDESN